MDVYKIVLQQQQTANNHFSKGIILHTHEMHECIYTNLHTYTYTYVLPYKQPTQRQCRSLQCIKQTHHLQAILSRSTLTDVAPYVACNMSYNIYALLYIYIEKYIHM